MGHEDELELADRLREVLDTPAPPSRANVDSVISRGRRRLALLRASSVLGVVVVVGGISFTAFALRGVGGGGAHFPPAAARVTTATASSAQPGQAWSQVPPSPAPGAGCHGAPTLSPAPGLTPDKPAIAAFAATVRGTAVQGHVADPVVVAKDQVGGIDVFAEVSDAGGVGSVHLFQYHYAGSPLVAADKAAQGYRGCDTVLRVVRPSGAVLQLREKPTASPQTTTPQSGASSPQTTSPQPAAASQQTTAPQSAASSQPTEPREKPTASPAWPYLEPSPELAIYLPDARLYGLTQSRYASASLKSPSSLPPYIVPRKTLPLTDRQFQAAAEDFVARLGF